MLACRIVALVAVSVIGHSAGANALGQSGGAADNVLSGKVIRIADGDTLTVYAENKQHTIRLDGIDAPERKQAFGTQARKALSDKAFGKEARIGWFKRDRYGRILGHVSIDGHPINHELVQEGWAWHYKHYNKDQRLADYETEAREAKRGLWQDDAPIPPWEFRRTRSKQPANSGGGQRHLLIE